MNKKVLLLVIVMFCLVSLVSAVDTKEEYYDTNDDEQNNVHGLGLQGQTFNTSVSGATFTATVLSAKLCKASGSSPTTPVWLILRSTDADDNANPGAQLGNCSFDGALITSACDGSAPWYNCTLSPGITITHPDEYYQFQVHCPDCVGDTDHIGWRMDLSSPTYLGGMWLDLDAPSSNSARDFMFRIYSTALPTPVITGIVPSNNTQHNTVFLGLNATITNSAIDSNITVSLYVNNTHNKTITVKKRL